jgi:hypothetical protein
MRNLRILGLAFVAALALSAMAAASAFATYDSEVATTTLSGSQTTTNVFTTNKGTVKCEVANFSGTQSGTEKSAGIFTSATIKVHPTYEKCKAFGLNATVTTTGCDYEFATAVSKAATVKILCEAGKEIIVNGGLGTCVVKVKGQSPGGTVSFTNEGAEKTRSILVTSGVTGIAYASSGFCGAEEAVNGTYEGTVTTKGFSGAEQRGIWVT